MSISCWIDTLGNDDGNIKAAGSQQHHDICEVDKRYYEVGPERGEISPQGGYPGRHSNNSGDTCTFGETAERASSDCAGNLVEWFFRSRAQCHKGNFIAS